MTAPNDVFKTTVETVATETYDVEKLKRIVQWFDTWKKEDENE